MPEKGKIMSQAFYEKQSRLLDIYQDLFITKEMNEKDTVKSLKMLGFSETIAVNKIQKWAALNNAVVPVIDREKKQMLKEKASLEKYVFQMSLGKKYYIRLMFKEKKLTRAEAIKKLIKPGCNEETVRNMVSEWEEQG